MKILGVLGWVLLLVFLTTCFIGTQKNQVTNIDQTLYARIQQNRTILTCYDNTSIKGGQGTIIQTDNNGVYVVTADHVVNDTQRCEVQFRDGTMHNGYTQYEFKDADVAIEFIPGAFWLTSSKIAPMHIGDKDYVFGEVSPQIYVDASSSHTIIGAMFTFNDTLYDGTILTPVPAKFISYVRRNHDLMFTNLYAAPGSSGGGVFNREGNLVGIVSGGSIIDSNITYVVDLEQAVESEGYKGGNQ
jgi:S1-C subfamily serine protease